jgi:hypothetical protein
MNEKSAPFDLYAGFSQIAYVTTDFERALGELTRHFGVGPWVRMPDLLIETAPGRSARAHVGLALVGPVEIEVIAPCGEDDEVYRWRLPEKGYGTCLHHLAHRFEALEQFEHALAQAEVAGISIAVRGTASGGAVRYFYTDQREALGHFVEHVWYQPEVLAQLHDTMRRGG